MSAASIAGTLAAKAGLFAAAVAALVAMLALDRRATSPLFPSDAFSLRSVTGVALWFALLVSLAYSPLSIFVPIFLQSLHGFDPLVAGYIVAGASLGWTVAAVAVAGLPVRWSDRMMVAGPLAMSAGLLGVGLFMTAQPVAVLPPLIVLTGLGIGVCWVFGVQGIMAGAEAGRARSRVGFRGDRAADRLRARRRRLRHRRQRCRPVGWTDDWQHRQRGFLGADQLRLVAMAAAVMGWRLVSAFPDAWPDQFDPRRNVGRA